MKSPCGSLRVKPSRPKFLKMNPEFLQKQWDSIDYKSGGFLQIDILHPLEWFIGYQDVSGIRRKTLLIISHAQIETVESSKSMDVIRRRKEDGRWTLAFELINSEQEGVFSVFCCDMIEYSRVAKNETSALILAINRYKHWSRLLRTLSKGLMDESARKGLIGELLFLEEKLQFSTDTYITVNGWVGANGADQDFMYSDCWHEIKTVGVSAEKVTISSLEQLDCTDEGELVIFFVEKANSNTAFSLNDLVANIKNLLLSDIEALELFESKLIAYGYIDLQEYSQQKYSLFGTKKYQVDSTFPKLTTKSVPTAIISLKYEISLPSVESWKIC